MTRTATDGFKFWDAYYDALKLLDTDAERGHFVMALCAYVFDGAEPELTGMERFGFTLIAKQAAESKRLTAQGRKGGKRSGESRRARGDEKKFSTKVFDNEDETASKRASKPGFERKKEGLSSSYEEERRGLRTPALRGPAPPPPGTLPPMPGGDER